MPSIGELEDLFYRESLTIHSVAGGNYVAVLCFALTTQFTRTFIVLPNDPITTDLSELWVLRAIILPSDASLSNLPLYCLLFEKVEYRLCSA